MRKGLGSSVKVFVLLLFVIFLFLIPSCKKSSPQASPEHNRKTTSDVNAVRHPQADKVGAVQPSKPSGQVPGGVKSDVNETGKPPSGLLDTNHPAGWVPIEIKLPKPMFVGTPQDTRVPNLEKPRARSVRRFTLHPERKMSLWANRYPAAMKSPSSAKSK